MSTKTQMIGFINTIVDGGVNTALKVRTALNDLLTDNYGVIYGGSNYTSSAYPEITTQVLSNVAYRFDFVKQGRLLHFSGQVRNQTGALIENQQIFTIANTEFSSIFQNRIIGRTDAGQSAIFTFNGNTLTADILAQSSNYYLNGTIILTD
jgi:hypothetical protein